MDLVLSKDLTNHQSIAKTWEDGTISFKSNALAAFYDFLVWRFIWVALMGVSVGIILTNGGDRWLRRFIRNGLMLGPLTFVLIAGCFVGWSYLTLDRTPEVRFTGMASELPKVLALVKTIGSDYPVRKNVFQNVVDGMVNVSYQVDHQATFDPTEPRTRILVASDIHDNILGTQIASELLNNKELGPFSAVLLTGDITTFGTKEEAQSFDNQMKVRKIPVYLVGGNHESRPAMDAFKEMGYIVLEGAVIKIDDLSVMGDSDPLAESYLIDSDVTALETRSDDMTDLWNSYSIKPQVVAVHDVKQAEGVIQTAKKAKEHLTVIFGHNHKVSVKTDGTVDLIGAGTGGASGFDEIGRNPDSPYTYQILDFSRGVDPKLLSVTTLSFEGLNGKLTTEYTPIN